jgi:hypothetical protein
MYRLHHQGDKNWQARSVLRLLVTANVVHSSPIRVTLMMEVIRASKMLALTKPCGITSQKTAFFLVTAVKTSNLTLYLF